MEKRPAGGHPGDDSHGEEDVASQTEGQRRLCTQSPANVRPTACSGLRRRNIDEPKPAIPVWAPGLGARPGPAPPCDGIDGEGDEQHDPGDDVRGCCA